MSVASISTAAINPVAITPAVTAPAAATSNDEDGFSFGDLLDIVNPLQHIPIVSTLYRAITGDEIKTAPKLAGDFLFGGITGFASSMADTVFTKITGKSVGDTVLAWAEEAFSSSPSSDAPATGVASADPPARSGGLLAWIENEFSSSPATVPATAVAAAAPLATTATAVATEVPALPAPASVTAASLDTIVIPGQDALLMALSRNGVGQDVALRAADAYRRTLNVSSAAAQTALRGAVN